MTMPAPFQPEHQPSKRSEQSPARSLSTLFAGASLIGRALGLTLLASTAAVTLSGCAGEQITQGYLLDEAQLAKLKPGMDASAVLQIMGSPSTVSTVGSQTWYYVSEKMEIGLRFMGPKVVDRRVVVLNFTKANKIEKIANYGLQDGAMFDFISRTTPTGGNEPTLLRQLLRATGQMPSSGG